MFTVFLQQRNNGVGMGYEEFVDEFERICAYHLVNGRAKAFGFIFYDMTQGEVRNALKSADGYRILNDMSGEDITLFYLHTDADGAFGNRFNKRFMRALGVQGQAKSPCTVFFRFHEQIISDVSIKSIDKDNEPYLIIEEMRRNLLDYKSEINQQGKFQGLIPLPFNSFIGLLRDFRDAFGQI